MKSNKEYWHTGRNRVVTFIKHSKEAKGYAIIKFDGNKTHCDLTSLITLEEIQSQFKTQLDTVELKSAIFVSSNDVPIEEDD